MIEAALTSDRLRALAPEPFTRWDDVAGALGHAIAPDRRQSIEALVASLLGADPSPSGPPIDDRAVLAFAEQFVLDVSSCTADQRAAAMAALGADAFPFVQVLYVADFGSRMRGAWLHLFGTDQAIDPQPVHELWPALESFMSSVARLTALDPLTTEIVRLRGARAHNCRLCKSLRNVRAANDGADESVYDQIDHYQSSTLSERHQTALRLVDTMVWTPWSYPADLGPAVRAAFGDAEAVELVLDIARNAANKIAVAFGADDAHVTEGVEFYDVDDAGELVYGLTPTA